MAIASSAAWLAWRAGGEASLRREAERFAGAIEYAAQRAQWRHEDLGVSAAPGGWRFWKRDAERREWVPVADDDVLAAHALPEGIAIASVTLAGRALAPAVPVPLRASGRNDPSAFLLVAGASRMRVDADPLNRVVVSTDER